MDAQIEGRGESDPPMSRDAVLEAHARRFRYNAWVNNLLLESLVRCAASSGGSQSPSDPLAQATLLLTHVLRAEEVWHARIHGRTGPITRLWEPVPLDDLPPLAEACAQGWRTLVADMSAEDLGSTVAYRNSHGERFEQRLHDVLDHVANHGTHHRGQIVLLLRQAGFPAPVTDLIAYQREGEE